MRKTNRLFIIVLTLLIASVFVLAPLALAAEQKIKMSSVLQEKDGAYFIVVKNVTYYLEGNVIKELVGKKVQVLGVVKKDDKGKMTMTVETMTEVKPQAKPGKTIQPKVEPKTETKPK